MGWLPPGAGVPSPHSYLWLLTNMSLQEEQETAITWQQEIPT